MWDLRSAEVMCKTVGCMNPLWLYVSLHMLLPIGGCKQPEQMFSVLLLDILTGCESLQGGVQSRGVQRGHPGWV